MEHGIGRAVGVVRGVVLVGSLETVLRMKRRQLITGGGEHGNNTNNSRTRASTADQEKGSRGTEGNQGHQSHSNDRLLLGNNAVRLEIQPVYPTAVKPQQ